MSCELWVVSCEKDRIQNSEEEIEQKITKEAKKRRILDLMI